MQLGATLLHAPVVKHVVREDPARLYPALHVYVTTWPVKPDADDTVPLTGAARASPHVLGAHVGTAALHSPTVVHVADVAPCSVYPILHANMATPSVRPPPPMAIEPCGSVPSAGQLFAVHVGPAADHTPLGKQVVAAAPDIV